ncbi:MAG: hypothetical protein ACKPKO_44265, partial [Candidatus Fonsibacter sp.]
VANYKQFIHKAESPIVFHAANGKTTTNNVAWIHVHELDDNITPNVMANAPLVLTVGFPCMEKGILSCGPAVKNRISCVQTA